MKQKINGWWTWLLGGLLALLGFTSCRWIGYGLDEYGSPHADYRFIGEVSDEEGKPIEGIRVVVEPDGSPLDPDYDGWGWYDIDTLYTDASGKVDARLKASGVSKKKILVELEDVDGAEHGEFEGKVLNADELTMTQTREGDKNWYNGAFTIQMKTQLKKK